jgi:ParB family transcriptional regulator, chromosome partitioning protein
MGYESNAIFWIETEKIVPNPFQPRREFDQAKLKELADSIRMYGILQPLVVTRREIIAEHGAFTTEYELIAGERRLRASKLAGLAQVPVIIRSGEESQLMKLELAIIENLQREDLNAVDRALAFKQLSEQFGLSHGQVGEKVGRSREYVSNSIRLLLLPEVILNALRVNDISDGHARTLLMLNDRPEEQDVVFREILLKKLSVREVERISRKIATEKVRKVHWQDSDPELIAIEREFTETLGTRVQIQKTDFGGKLTIDYFAAEDLRKVLEIIHKGEQVYGITSSRNILTQIESATPLISVDESAPTVHPASFSKPPELLPAEQPVSPEMTQSMVSHQSISHDEEVFTRHDTLHEPETELTSEEINVPYSESEVIHDVLDKVSLIQHDDVVVSPQIPIQTSTKAPENFMPSVPPNEESKAAPLEDDANLYAIKNFSL